MDEGAAALLLAALSLLVAGLSLGWQVAQWLLSSGRPKAALVHGLVDGPGAYTGPVRRDGARVDLRHLRDQGIAGREVIGVQVTNVGRAPVQVERIAVQAQGGRMSFVPLRDRIGPDLPHSLQPGTNATWYASFEDAALLASSSREVLRDSVTGVFMTVQLGDGRTIRTKRVMRV